jgi:hypothetical protein
LLVSVLVGLKEMNKKEKFVWIMVLLLSLLSIVFIDEVKPKTSICCTPEKCIDIACRTGYGCSGLCPLNFTKDEKDNK